MAALPPAAALAAASPGFFGSGFFSPAPANPLPAPPKTWLVVALIASAAAKCVAGFYGKKAAGHKAAEKSLQAIQSLTRSNTSLKGRLDFVEADNQSKDEAIRDIRKCLKAVEDRNGGGTDRGNSSDKPTD